MLKMLKTSITGVILFAGALLFGTQNSQDVLREVAYRGSKLEGEVYLCTSDRVTSAGFRRNPDDGTVAEVAEISKQRNITTWRITLKKTQAEVIALTGATQTLEAPEQFLVSRGPGGLLLTRNDHRPSTLQFFFRLFGTRRESAH